MNTLIEIYFPDSDTAGESIIVISYFSNSHNNKRKIHTEFFRINEIYRLSLNGSSMTIHWNKLKVGLVLMIRTDFDKQKIIDFVNMKYPGKGLKVIQHFAKLKSNE